jgi:acyl-[acyl-carrier-protein]-phospholipid O-acyltransferase / long-chain-fatty-acid--[acyl-carrier-protein] ligase
MQAPSLAAIAESSPVTLAISAVLVAAATWLIVRRGGAVARALGGPVIRTIYDLRVMGAAHVPARGGALLVANHVSYADAFLLAAAVDRPVRFLMHRSFFANPLLGFLARWVGAIPVAGGDSAEERERALEGAALALQRGELVGIFAEGRITRTGSLLGFRRGLETIARSAGAPIVPAALDEVWGSIFSFAGGRALARLPRKLPYRVGLHFGPPLAPTTPSHLVRDELQALLARSAELRESQAPDLARAFLASARRHAGRPAIDDGSGTPWTYRRLAADARTLGASLRPLLGDARRVGVFLPPGPWAVLVHVTLALEGRAAVLLDDLATPAERAAFCNAAGVTHVLALAEREPAGLGAQVTLLDPRRCIGAQSSTQRSPALKRLPVPGDEAVILLTQPHEVARRSVVLAHRSVASNVRALAQVGELSPQDRVLAALPLTQAYGVTVSLWAPLLAGACIVPVDDPGDARAVAARCRAARVTALVATPGLYQRWLEAFEARDVAGVRLAISGGAHLDAGVREAWAQRLSCDLHEGYGVTEMGPVIAVNLPDVQRGGALQNNHRVGTVGRSLPGTAVRILRVPTGERAEPDELGRILVRGPGRMLGLLGGAPAPAPGEVDAWFDTGDVGALDRDGFLRVLGRAADTRIEGGRLVLAAAPAD